MLVPSSWSRRAEALAERIGLSYDRLLGLRFAINVLIATSIVWFTLRKIGDPSPMWAIASVVAASDPEPETARTLLVLAVLGMALTVIWILNNNKTHEYAVYWLNAVRRLEHKLVERSGEIGIDFAAQVKHRPRADVIYIRHPYLVQASPTIFFCAWTGLIWFGVHSNMAALGTHPTVSYETASLLVAIASLLLSATALLVAKSSLSQTRRVAERDQQDWKQQKWADMYLKANETHDALDRFRVLAGSWDAVGWEREWNDLMRLIRGAHAMAVVFPQNEAIGCFFSSTAIFKDKRAVSDEDLSRVFDAVELVRQRALLPATIL